ncbi:MAG: hypothetical protein AAF687_08530 [Pseudomonadota bacterium]
MSMLSALLLITAQSAPVMIQCPVIQRIDRSQSIARVQQPVASADGSERETLTQARRRAPSPVPTNRTSYSRTDLTPRTSGQRVDAEAALPEKKAQFVGELVDETFRATTLQSAKQMESYADLTAKTSDAVNDFVESETPRASAKLRRVDPRCKDIISTRQR